MGRRSRRAVASGLVLSLVMGATPAGAEVIEAAGFGAPEWADQVTPSTPADDPAAPPFPDGAESAPLIEDEPVGPSTATAFPAPGVSEVVLGSAPDARSAGSPIEVVPTSAAAEGVGLSVEVLDTAVARRAGVSGFVFRVAGAGGQDLVASLDAAASATDATGKSSVELNVGYEAFAGAYGANFVDRMRVVALPACALTGPPFVAGCDRDGVVLPQHVDLETKQLVVEIDDLAALETSTLAGDAPVDVVAVQTDDSSGYTVTPHPTVSPEAATTEPAATSDGAASTTAASDTSASSTTTSSTTSTLVPPSTTTTVASSAAPDTEATTSSTTSSTSSTTSTSTTQADTATTTVAPDTATSDTAASGDATAQVAPAAGFDGGVMLAVTSGTSGNAGTFEATPLSISHDWQVGIGSGEFSWSYPIPLPAAPAGDTPSLGLGYSSSAVDGLVASANAQSGPAGLGWGGFEANFIERRYVPCVEEDPSLQIGDLCWKNDNAVISLNGMTSELVKDPNVWGWSYRLKDDPGWRVERRNDFVPNGDNDGENWVVTSPDGTEYWFGYGINPDAADPINTPTYSTWTVPVFGNGVGTDPCTPEGGGIGWCNQAWRWNLDRVVDPDGNVTTYTYWVEHNKYGFLNGWGDADYIRSGRLHTIEYGRRAGSAASGEAKVVLEAEWRCGFLVPECPAPASGPGAETGFPDVPTELICSADCVPNSPTFFYGYRNTKVKTYTKVSGAYQLVDEIRLAHGWQDDGEGNLKLWLTGIQRIGHVGGPLALPAVNFLPVMKNNRVDYDPAQGESPMRHPRVAVVVDEYGARTDVTYGQPDPCSTNPHPDLRWDINTLNCFPQKWVPEGQPAEWALFHKYVTTSVTTIDTLGGSPPVTTSYLYEGGGAWHYNDDEFVGEEDKTWSDWRGYGDVLEFGHGGKDATKYRVFRGLNADRLAVPPYLKTVYVAPLTGGSSVGDFNWMAGRVLESVQYASNWTTILSSTRTDYQTRTTTEHESVDWQDWARWTNVSTTTDSVRGPNGAVATQQSTTTFNADLQPETYFESGWLDNPDDQRCTISTYARNPGEWMLAYPSSERLVAGDCNSSDELTHTEWYYDEHGASHTLHAMGSTGRVTASRSKIDAATNEWTPYETTGYDALGRPTTVTNARGKTTTTTFTPTTGYPATTQVENALGHVATTNWQVQRGVPLSQSDPNGNLTTYEYDPLGQLLTVRQPTEQPASSGLPPSVRFSYQIDAEKDDEPLVWTRRLTSEVGPTYEDSWVIYDALLRERQVQTLSPEAAKVVVAETTYDERGLVAAKTSPQAVTGPQGLPLGRPGDRVTVADWDNSHRYVYDDLGRQTHDLFMASIGVASVSDTIYTHYSIESVPPHATTPGGPPQGGRTLSVMDAYGRTVRVDEHDGTDWQTTEYTHDLAGNLQTVTDPAGNVIDYDYDMLGRRTSQDDPDSGIWTFGYDAEGNQTRVTDAKGEQIHTIYDDLDRPLQRREDSTSGNVLVEWAYDSLALGQLTSATRYTTTGAWTASIVGYDGRNRPTATTLSVPATVTGLGGTYTTGYTYDRADRVVTTNYPAVGGLAAEAVTTTYNNLGLPESMVGAEEYVWGMTYDNRGRPTVRASGPQASPVTTHWEYDWAQRLARLQGAAGAAPGVVLTDHQFDYDLKGNIVERGNQVAAAEWRECFDYDDRQRLDAAHTVNTAECSGGTPGTGDVAYEHDYTYSPDGNLIQRIEDATTSTYTYPAGGQTSVRPHAPTEVDQGGAAPDEYVWDANGNLDTRTVDGAAEDFTWTPEQLLESVTSPSGTTGFVYGPAGERLLRTLPDGTATLYLAGHEVTAAPGGTTVTATRTYSFAGDLIATRTPEGVDYLLTDQQGSIEVAVPSGATSPSQTRTYLPYGNTSSDTGTGLDTDRGWIGQIEDDTTDLSYLNARYYDPDLGRFLSPDPLFDAARPQTINPYTYGLGNPSTNTDPTGLYIPVDARNNSVIYHAKFNGGRGGFAGNHDRMAELWITPKHVSNTSYRSVWDQTVAFWSEVANNPGAMAYFGGLQTQLKMHSGCPTAGCVGLYFALAEVGAERLMQIANQKRALAEFRWNRSELAAAQFATLPSPGDGDGDGGFCILGRSNGRCRGGHTLGAVKDVSKDVSSKASIGSVLTAWAPEVSLALAAVATGASAIGTVTECVDGGKGINCFYSVMGTVVDYATLSYAKGATTIISKIGSWGASAIWALVTNVKPLDDSDSRRCSGPRFDPEMVGEGGTC